MMSRRKAWNGNPPKTTADARRRLLDIACECIERLGPSKTGLSDVAQMAGVTRQTVYRYFDDADDLFNSAAALASGGLLERMRRVARSRDTLAERIVECIVFSVREIPRDVHLAALNSVADRLTVSATLRLSFVQEEIVYLADGAPGMSALDRDELAEILLRLTNSFLADPGEARTETELRAFLTRWLVPMIEARLSHQ